MFETMSAELSDSEVLVLQTMWELKALAEHSVTVDTLAARLSSVPKMQISEELKRLELRGFVSTTRRNGDEIFALSSLGAACARQLLDAQLGDMTRTF